MRRVVLGGLVLAALLGGCSQADSADPVHTPLPAAGDKIVAVVDPFEHYLLGGAQGGKWLRAAELAPLLGEHTPYRVYFNDRAPMEATGAAPVLMAAPCNQNFEVTLLPANSDFNIAFIATSADWEVQPRPLEELDVNTPEYQELVRALLAEWDIGDPPVAIQRILRTDLDGDGVDEVLVQASSFGTGPLPPTINAGDYELVALRTVINGTPQTVVVEGSFFPQAEALIVPSVHTLDGVADLNGDGTLELIISSSSYAGRLKAVYTVEGAKVTPVIDAGCAH